MSGLRHIRVQSPHSMRGLSLIELMIAMLLGLLVVGAAIGIFITNRQTYVATESLGRVQEGVRTAFELMARDVREAAGNPCNSESNMAMVNTLNTPTANWWKNWGGGSNASALQGYGGGTAFPDRAFGTVAASRVNGTDALVALSGGDRVVAVTAHTPGSSSLTVATADHGYQPGDLLVVCGPNSEAGGIIRLGAIFGMTGAAETTTIGNAASSGATGNATSNLGLGGALFTFGPNAVITRLHATRWYVGNNARGGRSLYQGVLTNGGVVTDQEVVEGIRDMTLTYLVRGANGYVDATVVGAQWNDVVAVNINLVMEGTDRVGTDGNPLQRQLNHVATLRNRNP